MAQKSKFWNGISFSSGPYYIDDFSSLIEVLFQTDLTKEGVLSNQDNELDLEEVSSTEVKIKSGRALVKGTLYVNTDDISLYFSVPEVTTYHTIMLRKDYLAQTIRVVKESEVTSPYIPEQVNGIIWEIPIFRCELTPLGVLSNVDLRSYCSYRSDI